MDFSVIVPVRNRPEEIARCVASLYRVDYDPTRYEVIVVDNGSTDETARMAVQSGARVISEPQPARSRARNTGARVARGKWLAFTDSDCEVDPGWLRELAAARDRAEAAPEKKIGLLAGMILSGAPKSAAEAYIAHRRWLDQEKFLTEKRKFSPPFAATANLAVRADIFWEIGGFDVEIDCSEDADLCWRAAARGWNIDYVPLAKVTHHHRASVKAMLHQAYDYGVANAALFAKHRALWNAKSWIDLRWHVWSLKGLAKSPWSFATGRTAMEKRIAWYDFLCNFAQAAGRFKGGRDRGILVL